MNKTCHGKTILLKHDLFVCSPKINCPFSLFMNLVWQALEDELLQPILYY